jgi:serine/threonine protein kinase
MDPHRWRQVSRLFHDARAKPPGDRPTFLDAACGGDIILRREVESLLVRDAATDAMTAGPVTPMQPGTMLGHYRIERLIGRGGMGAVFQAYDTTLHRHVALKLVETLDDDDARTRVLREARAAAALSHPQICTVHEVVHAEGVAFIAMEYVEGTSLRARLDAGPLALAEALQLAVAAAEALAYAHEHGVVHRDFKAANIIVSDAGRLKIVDFGLARRSDALIAASTTMPSLVPDGMVAGTPHAMAPEQVRGEPADARTDIWALGVLIYEMVAGRGPFSGATVHELFAAILTKPPAALPPSLPLALHKLIERALEKNRSDRYPSTREMLADLRQLARSPVEVEVDRRRTRRLRHWGGLAAAVAVIILAIAALAWVRTGTGGQPASRADWVQLTHFSDSVTQPSLSPDGRMLTFVRGPGSFSTEGQIYVKLLPDGEPKPLTDDQSRKMSPVFSPDSSRIAYTTGPGWNTWVVPVLGGAPREWLPNASGLAWRARGMIVFSEIIDRLEGNHMKIVAAAESRVGAHDVYVPSSSGGMAHRSFPSPDGQSVLLAEMTDRGVWLPCRLVAIEGRSPGQQVGPPGAACWFAGWSPDGKWMYINSDAGGTFHIWRQRFSATGTVAPPEQLTSGPTSEEGIAIAPDGRWLVTSVGLQQRALWVHDARGDRQISAEGRASKPKISADGHTLFYLLERAHFFELWTADIASGRTEALLPGFRVSSGTPSNSYDVSPTGREVVLEGLDQDGRPRIWIAAIDRRSPPRIIPGVEGDGPVFGRGGEIYFRAREGTYGSAYRVNADGSGLSRAIEYPVIETRAVSPDGHWLVVYARYAAPDAPPEGATMAFPLGGGPGIRVFGASAFRPQWSPDAKVLYYPTSSTSYSGQTGRTYAIPLSAGRMLPVLPDGGFRSEAEILQLPGVRVIDSPDVAPGPTADIYAYSRETTQRNLYSIPLK